MWSRTHMYTRTEIKIGISSRKCGVFCIHANTFSELKWLDSVTKLRVRNTVIQDKVFQAKRWQAQKGTSFGWCWMHISSYQVVLGKSVMWLSKLVEEKFLYDRLSGFKSVCCPTVLHSGIRISTGGIAIKGLWQWNLQWSFRVVRLSKKCQFTTHKTLHCWIYHQYFLGADKFIYSMLGLHTAD